MIQYDRFDKDNVSKKCRRVYLKSVVICREESEIYGPLLAISGMHVCHLQWSQSDRPNAQGSQRIATLVSTMSQISLDRSANEI